MASLSSAMDTKKSPASLERRPLMLKDYLSEETNSSPSNDFLCYPRRHDTTVRNLLEIDLNTRDTKNSRRLLRNRSKAASTTISTFQKASETVINAIKNLPFSPVRSSSSSSSSSQTQHRPKQGILARGLSRRLKRRFWKKDEKENCETRVSIRVKDIIRWRSFGEVDFTSPIRSRSSSSSSWSESDVASDFLLSSGGSSEYSGESELVDGKKISPEKKPKFTTGDVGGDSVETTTSCVEPKGEENQVNCSYEEEQLSPVSVLDFPDEDKETTTCFQHSLANMERTTQQLLQKIRRFEILSQLDPVDLDKIIASSIEEKDEEENQEDFSQLGERAKDLLELLKSSSAESRTWNADRLLVDFFREGLEGYQRCVNTHAAEKAKESEEELLLTTARDWINGYGTEEWTVDDNREAYVSEMERRGRWTKFEDEESDLAMEMEIAVLGPLIEELLLDFLT